MTARAIMCIAATLVALLVLGRLAGVIWPDLATPECAAKDCGR